MAKKTDKTTVEVKNEGGDSTTVKIERDTDQQKPEDSQEAKADGEQAQDADNQEETPKKELSPMEKVEADLAEAQFAKADMQDKFLRLMAEFDNFRKRTAKEKRELRETAAQDLIVDLLTVIDDFDRAFKAQEDSGEKADEGMQLVVGKFKTILEGKGLKAMDAMGKDFDPDWHEAITEIPAPGDEQKGKVMDVIQKGYLLGEKIIRYAKVVVGK